MTKEDLKNISIKNTHFLLPSLSKEAIFVNCLKKNIMTIGDLLEAYEKGAFNTMQKNTTIQLKGIIDLINYFYFGDCSDTFLQILTSPLEYISNTFVFLPQSWKNILRLGFSSYQIRIFERFLFKNDLPSLPIFKHLENAYEQLNNERLVPLSEMERKNLLFKLNTILTMFYAFMNVQREDEKIASLEEELRETTLQIERLQKRKEKIEQMIKDKNNILRFLPKKEES